MTTGGDRRTTTVGGRWTTTGGDRRTTTVGGRWMTTGGDRGLSLLEAGGRPL